MTRQELEQLCQPQTPEKALEELELIFDGYGGDDNSLGAMPGMLALKAAIEIIREVIDEADKAGMATTVQVRRSIW